MSDFFVREAGPTMILTRDPFDPRARYTMGELLLVGTGEKFQTIERGWNGNKGDIAGIDAKDASCVPIGVYDLLPDLRPDGSKAVALVCPANDVYFDKSHIPQELIDEGRGRYQILIHPANWYTQVVGCIAPGERRVRMRNPDTGMVENAVSPSGPAFDRIMQYLKETEGNHTLDIRQANAPSLYD